ncbi:hypothetical protein FXO37_08252 [Capsicum annuum]|nr:hypothetical protein FXO37_08252 [Capsicum annuum]
MVNTNTSKKMNEKKTKVPQRGLGVAQLERIRLEEQNKKDSIFHSSRIDFRPNKSVPFLENCPKLSSDEYILGGVNQKVDHHGVVFGKNLNLPSVMQQRCQQYQQSCSSSSMMAGVKRPYPFSPEHPPVPSFRRVFPQCCVASVSRSHASASSSDDCSVNVEEGNARKREVFAKSRALSESGPSISARETKALDGDFLRLAPPAVALPHLEAVNRRSLTLQLFDCVPSRVAAAAHTPPSGLGISVQQPILGFSPSAEVQIGREEARGSDFHTEVGADVDLELNL